MALASAGRILGPDKKFSVTKVGFRIRTEKFGWLRTQSAKHRPKHRYLYPVYTFLNFFPLPKPSNNILCQCKEITDIIEDDDLRTEDLSWKEDEWISSGCIWRDIPQLDCDPD